VQVSHNRGGDDSASSSCSLSKYFLTGCAVIWETAAEDPRRKERLLKPCKIFKAFGGGPKKLLLEGGKTDLGRGQAAVFKRNKMGNVSCCMGLIPLSRYENSER